MLRYGVAGDVAAVLGVSAARFEDLRQRPDFPQAYGSVWDLDEVADWELLFRSRG